MRTFKHIHSSSRFDRSPESLAAAASDYNAQADLVTYTEVQYRPRSSALKEVGKATGFGLVAGSARRSNHDDCAVAFKKDVFELVYDEQFKTKSIPYVNAKGNLTDVIYATIAVLEHFETGKRIVVTVVHLPSSVQGALAENRSAYTRLRSWYATFRSAKRRSNKLRKRFKASGILFIADFNIDFKKAWARALIKSVAPGYSSTWKNVYVSGGTLGKRIIDATLLKGRIRVAGSAELLPDDNSSDHRPYKEKLYFLK